MGWGDQRISRNQPPPKNPGCPPEIAKLMLMGWLLFRVAKLLVRMVRR